jgi:hypothetical protein
LTVLLQWAAQVLTVLAGLSALFGETTARDPATRERRLTKAGYAKVALILVGFALYVATDRENARQRDKETAAREAQLQAQDRQLAFLHQLFLYEHGLSALEIGWPLRDRDYLRVEAVLRLAPKATLDAADPLFRQYLATAFHYGELRSSTTADVRPRLTLSLLRPQGMYMHDFAGPSPEWELFQLALRTLTTPHFQMLRSDGTPLIDLIGRHWPCDVLIADGHVTFTVRTPGIRFPDLSESSVFFEVADSAVEALPARIRLHSLDPRLLLDTSLAPHWHRHVWRTVQVSDDYTEDLATRRSDSARLTPILRLSPDTAASSGAH